MGYIWVETYSSQIHPELEEKLSRRRKVIVNNGVGGGEILLQA